MDRIAMGGLIVGLVAGCSDTSTHLDVSWMVGGKVDKTRSYEVVGGIGNNDSSDGSDTNRLVYWSASGEDLADLAFELPAGLPGYSPVALVLSDLSNVHGQGKPGDIDGTYVAEFTFIGLTGSSDEPVRWEGRFSTPGADGKVQDDVSDGVQGTFAFTNLCDGSIKSTFSSLCGLRLGVMPDLKLPLVATFPGGAGLVHPEACPEALWKKYAGGDKWTFAERGADLEIGDGRTLDCVETTVVSDWSVLCGEVQEGVEADGCDWTTSLIVSPGGEAPVPLPVLGVFLARSEGCSRVCESALKQGE